MLLLVCGVGVFARRLTLNSRAESEEKKTRNSQRENIKLMPITSQHPLSLGMVSGGKQNPSSG